MQTQLPRPGPDELGYLQLTTDGAVIASRGCLQNDEGMASSVAQLVSVALRRKIWPTGPQQQQQLLRMSVTYPDHCYVICMANKRLHVVKKRVANTLTSSGGSHE